MASRTLTLTAIFTALIVLGACQTAPKTNVDPGVQQEALRTLNAFSVTGGLGVWTDEESISTRIEWKQIADDFDLLIRLPAGLNTVQVTRQGEVATVRNGSTEPVIGRSAGRLMQQALGLGVAVPIEQMALWIKGVPGNSAESVQYDNQGRLASMDYVDAQNTRWQAKVLKYTTHQDVFVPATILATGGPYTVRLTLKNWSPFQATEIQVSPTKSTGRLKVPGR